MSTVNVGDVVTFTITVTNNGPDDATGVAVEDVIPSGYTNIANISNSGIATGATIDWTGLNIANGANVMLTFDAEVLISGDYVNVAQVTASDQEDPDSTPNDGFDPDGDGNIGSEGPDGNQDPDANEDDSDDAEVIPSCRPRSADAGTLGGN